MSSAEQTQINSSIVNRLATPAQVHKGKGHLAQMWCIFWFSGFFIHTLTKKSLISHYASNYEYCKQVIVTPYYLTLLCQKVHLFKIHTNSIWFVISQDHYKLKTACLPHSFGLNIDWFYIGNVRMFCIFTTDTHEN